MTTSVIKTIGLVVNPEKPEAYALASRLADLAAEAGVQAVAEEPTGAGMRCRAAALPELVQQADIVLVLGGDGTLLRVARQAAPAEKPMVGVNFGHYGFIMATPPEGAEEALARVLAGDFTLSKRLMLQVRLQRDGACAGEYFALNDVVVARGSLSRLLQLKVSVGAHQVVRYSADGLIVATPTGSTAYSLSAGGPVVHPDVEVFVLTPIAPHTLNSRSLVIPGTQSIELSGDDSQFQAALTVDGQLQESLRPADVVQLTHAPFRAQLVHTRPTAFYEQLESRLGFGERYDR